MRNMKKKKKEKRKTRETRGITHSVYFGVGVEWPSGAVRCGAVRILLCVLKYLRKHVNSEIFTFDGEDLLKMVIFVLV